MENARNYLVPDYYESFQCKMGDCRTACCEGWPISLSMKDYFKLLSVECSPETRKNLDCGMYIAEHPMPEAYAHILPRYDGNCPMRMRDGRCAIHAELGERFQAAVCRLYPRGIRSGKVWECSCANSCEGVLELFLNRQAKIGFREIPLEIEPPEFLEKKHFFNCGGREVDIRLWLIEMVQDRNYPLPQRLLILAEAMLKLDQAIRNEDMTPMDRLMDGREHLIIPDAIAPGFEQMRDGLDIANRMLAFMGVRSDSVRQYGESALRFFGEGTLEFEKYIQAATHFEKILPQWEIWFEHMLVNHMFFSQFPFQDRPVDVKDEFLGLASVYMMLRFLCLGWMVHRNEVSAAVDAAAATFRLVDHTEYDRYAAPILKELGHNDWMRMRQILSL